MLGDLLDGIAAVAQNTLFAIQKGDAAGGAAGVDKTFVQRHATRQLAKRRNIEPSFIFGVNNHRLFYFVPVYGKFGGGWWGAVGLSSGTHQSSPVKTTAVGRRCSLELPRGESG